MFLRSLDTSRMLFAGTPIQRVVPRRFSRPEDAGFLARRRHGFAVSSASGLVILMIAGWPLTGSATAATKTGSGASYAVAAQRGPLTTSVKSSVAHDTETEALTAQSGRLFATGQWGVFRTVGVGTDPGQEVTDRSVDSLRADAVPSGPGIGFLLVSE